MKTLIVLFLLNLATGLYSQDCPKCDIEILKVVSHSMDDLNFDDVKNFVCTFDSGCTTNVEFSEWSNELLFTMMQKDINILNRAIHDLGYDQLLIICEELEHPLKDYDLADLYKKVKNSDSPKDMIMEQSKALERAAMKDGIKLE